MSRTIKLLIFFTLSMIVAGCNLSSIISPQPTPKPPRSRLEDPAAADPAVVSLNRIGMIYPESGSFQFMVIGHIYGTTVGEDREPSPTLISNIDDINQLDLTMLVSLGDTVKHSEQEDFDILDDQVWNKLKFPVFNTVGNHDVENRELYEYRYGQTYFSFVVGPAQMIFLDTERTLCQVDDQQKSMMQAAIDAAIQNDQVKTIFIFMHKTLFFKNDVLFTAQQTNAMPNQWICYESTNFADILENTIKPASLVKPVYMFAGDVGAWGNLSPYYEKMENYPITMVMSGIGEEPNDAAILVEVNNDDVGLKLYPLTENKMMTLESYTPDYWESVKP